MRLRIGFLTAAVCLAACNDTLAPGVEQTVPLTGWYSDVPPYLQLSPYDAGPKRGMIRSRSEWKQLWSRIGLDTLLLPPIDFSSNTIVYSTRGVGSGDPHLKFVSAWMVASALTVHTTKVHCGTPELVIHDEITIALAPVAPHAIPFIDDPPCTDTAAQ